MKFIELGEGAQIDGLKVTRNIMVVDDISKVATFISVGKNGRITNLDAEGNEVHTPASYTEKLVSERADFFSKVDEAKSAVESIENDLQKQKIKNLLKEARSIEYSMDGEEKFQRVLVTMLSAIKDTGAAVLATCITAYFGIG
jgi:hypothetical protein